MTAVRRRCFIHIGTPKTGSTSLQAFLGENRQRFLECGVFLPETAGTGDRRFACHHAAVGQLLGEPVVPTGSLDSVAAELCTTDAPLACISSENFSLLHDRLDLLTRLRDTVVRAGFEPVIVAFVRAQASYATAIFSLNVLDGHRVPFPQFLAEILDRGSYIWPAGYGPQFDYVTLLDGFAKVFGHESIIVKPFTSYAPDDRLLRTFLQAILPQTPLTSFHVSALRANRTLTFADVLRRLGTPNDFDQHLRFAPLRLSDLLRIRRRFRQSNRDLFERYGVDISAIELKDVALAMPIRRSIRLTAQLRQARRSLIGRVSGSQGRVLPN